MGFPILVRRLLYIELRPWLFHGMYCSLTHLSMNTMAAILQMTFSNACLWMKSCAFWFEFHWSLFLSTKLTVNQCWFRWWLGAKQVTSHYLKQCWPSSLMPICGTRGIWVDSAQLQKLIIHNSMHYSIIFHPLVLFSTLQNGPIILSRHIDHTHNAIMHFYISFDLLPKRLLLLCHFWPWVIDQIINSSCDVGKAWIMKRNCSFRLHLSTESYIVLFWIYQFIIITQNYNSYCYFNGPGRFVNVCIMKITYNQYHHTQEYFMFPDIFILCYQCSVSVLCHLPSDQTCIVAVIMLSPYRSRPVVIIKW